MCIDQTASSSSAGVNSTTSVSSTVTREQHASKEEQPEQSEESLYSVLMTSHKENEAWKEAAAMEDRNFRPTRAEGSRRKAPFYKVLQGMPIAVDAFRYGTIPGVTAYFLTHAHSDHYTNLASNWKSGPIYCSEDTANLVLHMLAVDPKWVHPLPMDVPTTIPDTGGVVVTLIEANHCPGSCLFFFEGQQTVHAGDSSFKSTFVGSSKTFRYLHCGDFRASPRHVLHPAVKGKYIDHVYLDTTYLDPKYTFPPQPLVISACAELARRIVAGEAIGPADCNGKRMLTMDAWVTAQSRPEVKKEEQPSQRILVVIGTYSIGKERIVKAVAQALKTKIYCDARKAAILRCQTDPELHSLLTSDPIEGGVHLLPLGMITSDKIKPYVERFKGTYSRAVAFRPTGWTYTPPSGSEQSPPIASIISRGQACSFSHADLKPMQKSSYTIQMFGVPYSEHSSFFELTCFAMSCDWGKMIATVNVGSENSRAKMAKWVARWEAEKKRNKDSVVKYREIDYW
ncbi:DRMBL-domain-containing protein [Leucogyrophana mollusca]|uniref:DRMBL-domain-containing protein n=1 Tax=Leucogyrophana mollusca TaxID=85980 RepID=A0ACB8B3V0_9AGAM|nr:DRMBL-domain-containing protein [Leucogyrophana mollusca]